MKEIEFWFSIGSTYTYLSVTRLAEVTQKTGESFSWQPFSVRKIMREMDNIPFPPSKQIKVDYMWRDIERRAQGYGFTANVPAPYPLQELDLANRVENVTGRIDADQNVSRHQIAQDRVLLAPLDLDHRLHGNQHLTDPILQAFELDNSLKGLFDPVFKT